MNNLVVSAFFVLFFVGSNGFPEDTLRPFAYEPLDTHSELNYGRGYIFKENADNTLVANRFLQLLKSAFDSWLNPKDKPAIINELDKIVNVKETPTANRMMPPFPFRYPPFFSRL